MLVHHPGQIVPQKQIMTGSWA
ncbi:hypothetical protein [Acinetobacter sp. A47]